jgi:hypothetical protein
MVSVINAAGGMSEMQFSHSYSRRIGFSSVSVRSSRTDGNGRDFTQSEASVSEAHRPLFRIGDGFLNPDF